MGKYGIDWPPFDEHARGVAVHRFPTTEKMRSNLPADGRLSKGQYARMIRDVNIDGIFNKAAAMNRVADRLSEIDCFGIQKAIETTLEGWPDENGKKAAEELAKVTLTANEFSTRCEEIASGLNRMGQWLLQAKHDCERILDTPSDDMVNAEMQDPGWTGKVIGASLGGALGGPAGAFVFGALGDIFDSDDAEDEARERAQVTLDRLRYRSLTDVINGIDEGVERLPKQVLSSLPHAKFAMEEPEGWTPPTPPKPSGPPDLDGDGNPDWPKPPPHHEFKPPHFGGGGGGTHLAGLGKLGGGGLGGGDGDFGAGDGFGGGVGAGAGAGRGAGGGAGAGDSGAGAPGRGGMSSPMGGGGAQNQQEDRERETFLTEDEDVWGESDAPPGVIS